MICTYMAVFYFLCFSIYKHITICMYVRMYVRMYVHMYACMYVRMYTYPLGLGGITKLKTVYLELKIL